MSTAWCPLNHISPTRTLQVKIPTFVLHHYDVAINPDKCPRRVNREIVDALVKMNTEYFENQRPVFDGRKNLYSVKPLPGIGRDRVCMYVHVCMYITCTCTNMTAPTVGVCVYVHVCLSPSHSFSPPSLSLFFLLLLPLPLVQVEISVTLGGKDGNRERVFKVHCT